MIKVGLVPLDSRPVNTTWICDLGKIADVEVIMFPREKSGTLHQGASQDDIIDWIKNNVKNLNYLIISSDALCFGGLVQTRTTTIDANKTIKKLSFIKDLKEEYPHLKIYIFDTIMRLAITMLSDDSIKYYDMMYEYVCLKGKNYFFPDDVKNKRLKELENIIPNRILNTYLKARSKKREINKYFLSLIKDKIIDHLILLQEDATPYGMQAIDQQYLLKLMNDYQITDKIDFYNGTDEGAAVLLARIIQEESNKKVKTYIHCSYKEVLNNIHYFEDLPFGTNLKKMLNTVHIEICDNIEDADFILAIFGEKNHQMLDVNRYREMPIDKSFEYQQFIKKLNILIKKKPTILVDLQFANGGNIELLQDIDYLNLMGYSAWNTSSNSLGTALCQAVCALVGNNLLSNKYFLMERIMDDCVYQYIVRRKINERLMDNNISIHDLSNSSKKVLENIEQLLHEYDNMIDYHNYSVNLPWNRTFEVEIKIKEGKRHEI